MRNTEPVHSCLTLGHSSKEYLNHADHTLRNTIKALRKKAGLTPEAGIKNLEGWETYLKGHDAPGVKAIVTDLGKLKALLGADELDGMKIRRLVAKLGKETAQLGKGYSPNKSHIEELGTELEHAEA